MAVVLALLQFVPAMAIALHEPVIVGLDERLTNVDMEQVSWLLEKQGGRWGRYGWYLAAHEKGSLRIRLPVWESGTLRLRLWVYDAGPLSVQVRDGQQVHLISTDRLSGDVIILQVDGPSELIVQSANQSGEGRLIVDRFAAWWSKSGDRLPSLSPLIAALGLCLAGWGWLARLGSPDAWRLWIGCLLILVAVAVGWAQRWTLFEIARGLPADPDVIQYRLYANSLEWFTPDHGFYSGSFSEREPLHVAAIELWSRIWGNTTPAIRWYTFVMSVLLLIATGVFIWLITETWILGALAAWGMALNSAWSEEAVRGLRLESAGLLFLLLLSVWVLNRGWYGSVLLGLLSGILATLWAPMLSVSLGLFWLCWFLNTRRERKGYGSVRPDQWGWRQLGLASLVAITVFLPHLHGLYKTHGDASWPSYRYARWNANFEFPERIGTPGFPSAEEFSKDPYAGSKMTYVEYLFGLHSLGALLRGQIKGWLESTAYMIVAGVPRLKEQVTLLSADGVRAVLRRLSSGSLCAALLLLLVTFIGWLDLWKNPHYWWVPFLSLWGTWFTAFLYSVRLLEPFRHTAHIYPLLLFCLLWGGQRLLRWGLRSLNGDSIAVPE